MRKLTRPSLTRAVILLAALAIGYLIFTAADDMLLSRRLNREEHRLQQQIIELHSRQRRLEAVRDYLRTDEYVEGVARRVLGLVRPGETLIIVSSSAPTPTPAHDPGGQVNRPWWENLYGP